MDKPAQNIQDSFLNSARKEKLVLTIYLLGGVKLSGRIRSFDKYCLVLETGSQEQMVFKHAISTLVVQRGSGRDQHGDRHAPAPRVREEGAAAAAPAPLPGAGE